MIRDLKFSTPPRALFHLGLVIALLPLLAHFSSPVGGSFRPLMVSVAAIIALGVLWLIKAINWSRDQTDASNRARPWRFVIAPVLAVSLIGCVIFNLPLRARWLIAEDEISSFNNAQTATLPERIGTFIVNDVVAIDEASFVVIDSHGSSRAFLVSGGFARLPEGPDSQHARYLEALGGERIEFLKLKGDWYAWATYW